ncbi:hypothetical protein BDY24DRAFT_374703 [Mrakia frigida]|uniref:glycosyltransferase domain-containing protein n=1 Tax=Mrakia frigida TaxID=29902 RepID=UPI003FCC1008
MASTRVHLSILGALLFLTSLAFLRRQTHPLTLALFDSSSARLPREPKLHFLLPATNSPYEFCKTLLTTLVNDYEPIVINWGSKARDSAARIEKIAGVHDYIVNNVTEEDDLVFMIDAFDIWIQQPPSVLVSKYLALAENRILIGADKACWPWVDECDMSVLPQSTLPAFVYGPGTDEGNVENNRYRYNRPQWVNSGTIIVPKSLILPLYVDLLNQTLTLPHIRDDQTIFTTIYYHENLNPPTLELHPTLAIDFESDLFQVLAHSEDDMSWVRGKTAIEHPLKGTGEERLLWNRVSGKLPLAIHFNGQAKKTLKLWWHKMWWSTGGEGSKEERVKVKNWVKAKARAGGVTVAEDGRWISWEKLGCEADPAIWGNEP